MRNTVLFQNELYTVLDISTETYPGRVTIVDNSVLDKIGSHTWCVNYTQNGRPNVLSCINYKNTILSRFIMDAPDDMLVDHKNGNPFINIYRNMRLCTTKQNAQNRHKIKNKYKCVQKHGNRWRAQIGFNGKTIKLKSCTTPEEAALIYNRAAKILFGEFARLNIIEKEEGK